MARQSIISLGYAWLLSNSLFLGTTSACKNSEGLPIRSKLELPVFEKGPDEIVQTANRTMEAGEAALSNILLASTNLDTFTFENTIGAFDRMLAEFSTELSRIYLFQYTSDDKEMRDTASKLAIDLNAWYDEKITYNRDLYEVFVAFKATEEATELSDLSEVFAAFKSAEDDAELAAARLYLLNDIIDSYNRQGMSLDDEGRNALQAIQDRLTELTTEITININNNEGIIEFTPEELAGLSERQLSALEYNEETGMYIVRSAIYSQYRVVSTYATDPETRFRLLVSDNQRCMDENGDLILEVVQKRLEKAQLLGYDNYADYVTSDRMAGSGDIAYSFINTLEERLGDKFLAEQELLLNHKMEDVGDETLTVDNLNRWDIGFYRNKLLEEDYQVDHDAISEYFEEKATIRGVFDIYEELFGLKIEFQEVSSEDVWVEDAIQLVTISEAAEEEEEERVLGAVYLDLHPRDGKYKHFAHLGLIDGHIRPDGMYQAPVSLIMGNWPIPIDDSTPSLWTFSQTKTLLHELGHGIHSLLTCTQFAYFAGTSVPRDFVETPSQMLERWLQDINVIRRFAKHYETGEAMPETLLQSLLDSDNAMAGHSAKGQVSYGKSDLRIHTYRGADQIPSTPEGIYAATNEDYSKYYPIPENTATLASFGHLWGGYAAGYYGYAWANAIAADLASRFRNSPHGFMDKELGALFRSEILEKGGSRDPNESVSAFLGREWNTDAYFEELLATRAGTPAEGEPPSSSARLAVGCFFAPITVWLMATSFRF